jgi:acyl transferase domain-containing protein/aryl carrier-like protein
MRVLLEDATVEIKRLRRDLSTLKAQRSAPIAIIGIGCRFPGKANDPNAYWSLLESGTDAVSETRARWPEGADQRPPQGRWAGLLEAPEMFDAAFFGISPREAERLDPQQRMLLQVTWEALEEAGLAPHSLSGSKTGVFVGIASNEYGEAILNASSEADAYDGTGNGLAFAAGRLAYTFGLHGPSFSVDTACSSSLVALHLAARSLRSGECELAIAGGVSFIVSERLMDIMYALQALSPDGRSKAFDASANGFVRGEGCGVVILKRLADAVRDGDRVWAVIRGSAVNQDGRSTGLTTPNVLAQEALLKSALEDAGVSGAELDYIEAHGTGTSLGDPIEFEALKSVLGAPRTDGTRCVLGSVKTNVGHLEAAAGMAGLIKTVLALHHQRIPRHLHFRVLNPRISFEGTPFEIAVREVSWPRGARTRRAGVSSFGLSGTNAHIVLEEAPLPVSTEGAEVIDRPLHVLPLSAKTGVSLRALAARYAERLARDPELKAADVCFSAATGRSALEERLAISAWTSAELRERLESFAQQEVRANVYSGRARRRRIAFLFTGQGSQYAGMGQRLYKTQPVFKQALDRAAQVVPLSTLFDPNAALGETANTQPALFALEVALFELWRSWGVEPEAVLGHSVGEYAAACAAGVFSFEEGLSLVAARGRWMQALPKNGDMASVQAPETRVLQAIQGRAVSIAAVNGPEQVVISGERSAVRAVCAELEAEHLKTKKLEVSHAFHSAQMDPMLDALEREVGKLSLRTPRYALVSNVTGQLAREELLTPKYWREHTRRAVRFAAGMETLRARGIDTFIELGPHPTLSALGESGLDREELFVPSLRRNHDDWEVLLDCVARLHASGVDFDWRAFDAPHARRRVSLPTYAWEEQRFWIKRSRAQTRGKVAALLETHVELSAPAGVHVFEATLEPDQLTLGTVIEMALEAIAVTKSPVSLAHLRCEHLPVQKDSVRAQLMFSPSSLELMVRSPEGSWMKLGAAEVYKKVSSTPHSPAEIKHRCRERAGQLARGPGEAWAQIDPEQLVGGPRFVVPPQVLSRAFELLTFASRRPERERWVPRRADQLTWNGSLDRAAFVHADQCRRTDGALAGDVRILDAAGNTLFELRGVVLEPATRAERGAPLESLLFGLEWRELHSARTEGVAQGRWLLLAHDEAAKQLQPELEKRGAHVCSARAAKSFARLSEDHFELDPTDAAQLAQLIGETSPSTIVHGWALAASDADRASLEDAEKLCVVSGASLMKALSRDAAPRTLKFLTRGAHAFGDEPGCPVQTMIWSLAATLLHEQPELRISVLDADREGRDAELVGELCAPANEDLRMLREGRVYGRRMVAAASDHAELDATGTWLITGGLGGLGLAVARRLAERGATRLVLCSRSAPNANAEDAIRAIEALGARVQTFRADAADERALAAILDTVRRSMPPLTGVVHAAGIAEDAMAADLTAEQIHRVLAPKIRGAWNLDRLTREDPLRHFVLFSSIASVFGSPGQAHYAAANGYLDGLARARCSQGQVAVSINWGRWGKVGMAMRPGLGAMLDDRGIRALTVEDGLDLFERSVGGETQTVALDCDFATLDSGAKPSPLLAELSLPKAVDRVAFSETLAKAPHAERPEVLLAFLRRTLGALLKMSPDAVPVDRALPELGVDSIIAMQFVNTLRRELGMAIAVRVIFQAESLERIAGVLLEELGPKADDGLALELLREIEALTEEEALARLQNEKENTTWLG